MEDTVVHIERDRRLRGRGFHGCRLRGELFGDQVRQRVKLAQLAFGQGGFQGDIFTEELDVLHRGDELAHDLAAHRGPAAVFDDGDLALLQVVRGEVVQQVLHRDKHAGVIGGGGEDEVAAAEGIRDDIAGRGDGGVIHADLDAALDKFGGEDVGGILGVAVDRGVGEHDALLFGGVAAPEQILLQEVAEVAAPDKAVQRADGGDFQRRGLLQHCLNLRAVLADDVGVVAAGFVDVLDEEVRLIVEEAAVQRAEGAEGIGGEERLVGQVVGHHDFRPVDHRGHDEGELMLSDGEDIALFDQVHFSGEVCGEELRQHGLDFGVAEDAGLRIAEKQAFNGGGVVRLHMGDQEIVQLPAAERVGDIFKKDFVDGLVHGIEENGFLIQEKIGVVTDAVRNSVNALKAGEAAVIGTDPDQVVMHLSCAMHKAPFRPRQADCAIQ